MLVGMAVFVVITSVVVSVLLSSIRAQRKSVQIQNVADNSRFVLEKISRAVRQSTILSVAPGVLNLCHPTLGYPSSTTGCDDNCEMNCIDYRFDLTTNRLLERSEDFDSDGTAEDDEFMPITSLNVFVSSTRFLLFDSGVNQQPRVTILMTAKQAQTATKPEERAEIHLQTTITPRRLDIQ